MKPLETENITKPINLDLKLDLNKIKEIKERKEKNLAEVMSFIYESFETCDCWKELTPFQQYCLVEQTFLINFASFPSRIICAAALTALDDDKYYNSLKEIEKMNIRNIIKTIALKLKPIKAEKSFTISFEDSLLMKDLISKGIDKQLFVIFVGTEKYRKLAAKWGCYQLS